MTSDKKYLGDILFLEKRLAHLVASEDYEKCSRVKKWIEELEERSTKESVEECEQKKF